MRHLQARWALQVVEAAPAWRHTRPRVALRARVASLMALSGLIQTPHPPLANEGAVPQLSFCHLRAWLGAVFLDSTSRSVARGAAALQRPSAVALRVWCAQARRRGPRGQQLR